MGKIITHPHSVKLFVGMLSQDISLFDRAAEMLGNTLGPIDMEGPVWPWEHTSYYEKEMGRGLKRKFIFFEKLIHPERITEIKLRTNELEDRFLNENGGRRMNLDPGYLDAARVVLATTKDFSHRIYLRDGIYGEVTLLYSGNGYQTLPYTFPDYRTAEYLEMFKKAREIYKRQL